MPRPVALNLTQPSTRRTDSAAWASSDDESPETAIDRIQRLVHCGQDDFPADLFDDDSNETDHPHDDNRLDVVSLAMDGTTDAEPACDKVHDGDDDLTTDARTDIGTTHIDPQHGFYPMHLDRVICDEDRDVSLVDMAEMQQSAVTEDEDQQEQQYVPGLLKQARQQIVTQSVGRLRQAAGAESMSAVPEPDETALQKPRLSISATDDDDQDDLTPVIVDTKNSFRNLFTRLRQRTTGS
ncbi:MAG: hypothetical protein R3C59_16640 [Planctomycetaceae bacterium]